MSEKKENTNPKPLTLFNDETGKSVQIPVLKSTEGP